MTGSGKGSAPGWPVSCGPAFVDSIAKAEQILGKPIGGGRLEEEDRQPIVRGKKPSSFKQSKSADKILETFIFWKYREFYEQTHRGH
jgi:hypothetical protein